MMKSLKLLQDETFLQTAAQSEIEILAAIVVKYSSTNFYFFCKEILDFDLLTVETHKRWCDDFQSRVYKQKRKMMRLKPRGTYKSTIYGIGVILWLWGCIDPQLRIFYTSANALLLSEISDKLQQYIGNVKDDTLYSRIFGIVKDPGAKNTSEIFNLKGRSGKGFSLILRTSGGNTVGIHPNFVIVDDACDINDRESKAIREEKKRWFDTLTPLLVPHKVSHLNLTFETILYIGTRWHLKDLTGHLIEKNKKIVVEADKWDIEIESLVDKRGKTNYPDFISQEKVERLRMEVDEVFFACQYQNEPLAEGIQIFDLKRLSFVRPDQLDLLKGEIVCFFDPSLGKAHSDYPAVWWALYSEEVVTMISAIDKKVELSLMVHHIAAINKELNCRQLVYENNGVTLIEDALLRAHEKIKHKISIDSIHHSSNKHERIVSIQPALYSGFVRFMSDYETRYPEAMSQIVFYGAYDHDDFPDCLQMVVEWFKASRFKFIRYEEML